ncbi:ABC transporter permease [Singulisphaera sp. PoT]|uniref:ABC transporter permease n=1 Tax=Singulisphaera sp. PoT TaxID=3411797 RepID=UPI003BF5269E
MTLSIARKEFVDLVRDGRFRWAAAIVTLLLVAAMAVGWRGWREVRAEHEQAQAEARRHFEGQEEKNPHAAAHYGLYVFKPKPPLAFFDSGVDPYTGVSVHLEAHRRNEVKNRPARDATALQRFGELTASAVLQLLMPLLIIFLAFPAIAGEREQGTLRQLLSLGVRPSSLMLGKALGLSAALGLIVLPAIVLGVGLLAFSGPEPGHAWPEALVLAGGYLLYLGIFLAVSLLVSAHARSARGALVVLLGFWIVNAMIAPRLATDLARRAVATPSSVEFASAIQRDIKGGINGHDPEDKRLDRLKQELFAKHQVETIEELPINFQGVALQAGEEYGNSVFDRHYGGLWDAFNRQDRVRNILGVLFPTLAIRDLSMGLAGTDNRHARDFADSAESYRRELVRELNKDLEVNGADLGFMYQAGPDLWRKMPAFEYEPMALKQTLGLQAIAWASLAAWLLGSVVLVRRSTRALRAD